MNLYHTLHGRPFHIIFLQAVLCPERGENPFAEQVVQGLEGPIKDG